MTKSNDTKKPSEIIQIDATLLDICLMSCQGRTCRPILCLAQDETGLTGCGFLAKSAIAAYRQALKKQDQQTKRTVE